MDNLCTRCFHTILSIMVYMALHCYYVTGTSGNKLSGVCNSKFEGLNDLNSKYPKTYRNKNGILISDSAITWNIAGIKIKQANLFFGRSVELACQYHHSMTVIKRDWVFLDDYCKHKFLCYPSQTKTIDGRELNFVDSSATPGVETALCKNDFPYYFEQGIQHFTIWTIHNDLNPSDYMDSMYPNNKQQAIIFENLNINQSIKHVLHYHVLINERSTLAKEVQSQCECI